MKNKINENQKVTLTLGQLKKLVKESISVEGDFEIEDDILYRYRGKGGDVVIPNSVKCIEDNAFFACIRVTSATIPDGVTSIGASAFEDCSGLTSVTIPDSVRVIWNSAFSKCRSLTSIIIPDGVTNIAEFAFYECSGLTSIDIPDSVENIWDYAFSGCSGLTSVTIGNGVTTIGYRAFFGCKNLKTIRVANKEQRKMIANAHNDLPDTTRIIVKGEDSDDDEILVREASKTIDSHEQELNNAYKTAVHSCAEKIYESINALFEYYHAPFDAQSIKFKRAFNGVMKARHHAEALLAMTSA